MNIRAPLTKLVKKGTKEGRTKPEGTASEAPTSEAPAIKRKSGGIRFRGVLRERLKDRIGFLRRVSQPEYPKFMIKEPSGLIVLPYAKDLTKVDIKYPLLEPLAYAHIKWSGKEKKLVYNIVEPELTPSEKKIMKQIEQSLTEIIDVKLSVVQKKLKVIEYLQDKVRSILEETGNTLSTESYIKIMYYIIRDFVGLNEIEPLMHDPYIEDIGTGGIGSPVFIIHRRFGSIETNIKYENAAKLDDFVIKLSERCGRYISYAKPLLDGSLPDGSRVQATLAKDVTTKGPTFSIRKFRRNPFSPVDLINMGTASPEIMAYLWFLVENSISMLICGGVSTGKTTFLNALSMFIPPEDKVISIEDTRELNIPHINWIPAVSRVGFGVPEASGKRYGEITLFDLLKESFRMNPDYVIVGEVRGSEAYVMFQGIASGHPSIGTIHAGSVADVIKRLETPPIELSPTLIESLDIILVMANAKEKGKSARRIKEIVEMQTIDPHTGNAHTIKTFGWIPATDDFSSRIANSEILHKKSFEMGIAYSEIMKSLEERRKILEWMQKYDIVEFTDVSMVINMYYKERDVLMRFVNKNITPRLLEKKRKLGETWEFSTNLRVIE